MRVAFGLQDLFHIGHGIVVAPAACQLNGRRALCVQVVRCVSGPDQHRVEGCLIGAQVFSDAKRALGHARILGVDRLRHVVIEGDIQAIALAGQLRAQQAVQRVFAERAINRGLFRDGGNVFCRGRSIRGRGGQRLAATENDESKEQRGGSIHIRERRLTCGLGIMTHAMVQTITGATIDRSDIRL